MKNTVKSAVAATLISIGMVAGALLAVVVATWNMMRKN